MTKISEEELAHQVTSSFLRTINKIQSGRRGMRQFGDMNALTLIEAEMCMLVLQQPGISGSEIARILGVTPSATSQAIAKLKEKGCIRHGTDGVNAKTKRLKLTAKGRGATDVANEYYEMMKRELHGTSRRELQAYMRFVSKLERFHDSVTKLMGGK